jgi:DNA-binding transcriptional LysR family regulator
LVFVGQKARHARKRFSLAQLAAQEQLLTFQRGSQPHVALLDLCGRHGVASPRVHTISSISAMVQLVEQGFGVATLPLATMARLAAQLPVCTVKCDAELTPLPIHLSWRDDPATSVASNVVDSILRLGLAAAPSNRRRRMPGDPSLQADKPKTDSSKNSMKP